MIKHFMALLLFYLSSTSFAQGIDDNSNVLRVGILSFTAPYVMQANNNQFYGFDISTMDFVCSYLKVTCQYIPLKRDDLESAVLNNTVDVVIGGLVVSPHPEVGAIHFSMPYMTSEGQFISLSTFNVQQFSPQMLTNKKIGVVRDSAYANQIISMNLQAKVKMYETEMNIISAIQAGELDVGFMNNHTAVYWQHNSGGTLHVIGDSLPVGFGLGVLINSAVKNLVQDINVALYNYQNSPLFKKNYNLYLNQF